MKITKSSMRRAMYSIIAMAAIIVIAMAVYIVISSTKGANIDWNGMAFMMGAIGVFISPAFGGKVLQKRYEVKEKNIDVQKNQNG